MIFDDIQLAIDTGATIEIEYVNNKGEHSVRKLTDVKFYPDFGCTHGSRQIRAFCHLKNEERTFNIKQISRVTFLSGGDEEEIQNVQSIVITPINTDEPYRFDPSKRIFALYGNDYNC